MWYSAAQVGYDPWNDQRNFFAFSTYHIRPASGLFERSSPQVGIDRRWTYGAVGRELNVGAELELKPIDRFVLEPSYNYSRSEHVDTDHELFKEVIWRTRLRLQVNPRFSLRMVAQYDDCDVNVATGGPEYYRVSGRSLEFDPLVTYRVNTFSMIYVGSTHDLSDLGVPTDGFNLPRQARSIWRQSQRQFFVKLQYLFQV